MPAFNNLSSPSNRPGKREAWIQALEEQNERLAAYTVRVKAEIDELKRVINSNHKGQELLIIAHDCRSSLLAHSGVIGRDHHAGIHPPNG
jgi:hypothetical protein